MKKSKVLEFKVPKEKKVDRASLEKVKKARAAAQSKLTVTETVKYAGQTIQYVALFFFGPCRADASGTGTQGGVTCRSPRARHRDPWSSPSVASVSVGRAPLIWLKSMLSKEV